MDKESQILENEKYIVSQSPEINVGERLGWTENFLRVFPALENKSFRLFFAGQLISTIGNWLQMVAQGWLVFQLTHSALALGLIAALSALPVMLFALFGGVIVDRFPKRKILILTQASSMLLAFILGILAVSHLIQVWQIAILVFLLGTVNAVDNPARHAFLIEMVNRKQDLSSAIALNAGIFNGARAIGPAIAGFLIATIGAGWAFIINGISYLGVIIALFLMNIKEKIDDIHPHPVTAIKEGIRYTSRHPIIRVLLVFTAIVSIFGWSYATIMPFIAQNVFHVGASGLGYLYTSSGVGAVLAVLVISFFNKKISPLIFILGGNALFVAAIIAFTFVANFMLALFFLAFASAGLISQFSMINATIQRVMCQKYRGRVMSLYTLMFLGLAPLGNFQIGFLTEHFGPDFAIRLGAVISFCFALVILKNRRRIEKAYGVYRENNGVGDAISW